MSAEISEKVKFIDLLKKNFKLLLGLLILLFVIIIIAIELSGHGIVASLY